MCGFAGELRLDSGRPDVAAVDADGGDDGRPRARTAPGVWSRRPGRPRAPPAEDHRPVRAARPADGRPRARPDRRLQRLHLQLPRAARRAARAHGYRFFSTSDTEVDPQGLPRSGASDFVDHLLGMFAFAIVERDSGRVVLARDRLGIKPLYLAEAPGRAALRLHAARAARRRRRRHRDRPGRAAPLPDLPLRRARAAHDPARRRASCRRRPCGRSSPTAAARERALLARRRYERATRATPAGPSATGRTRSSTRCASRCERRMVADVPVGVLLSGGLDSSLIVGLLAEAGPARAGDLHASASRRSAARRATSSSTPTSSPSASAPTTTRSASATDAHAAGARPTRSAR